MRRTPPAASGHSVESNKPILGLTPKFQSWRYCALAICAVVLLSLVPHLYFLYHRGHQWNGTFPLTHDDEITYASYLSASIDGRPRRSDPYTGRDNAPGRPLAETYLSIQFVPPGALASIARALHLESLQIFFVLTLVAAGASALSLYWMFRPLLRSAPTTATAAIVVLCVGSANAWLAHNFSGGGDSANYLAFLRRYVPAFPLPLLFLFCGLVWRTVAAEKSRQAFAYTTGAVLCFAALVYSYFYLWTAAFAWLFCLSMLCAVASTGRRRRTLTRLGVVAALGAIALVPCLVMLSRRTASTDEAMMLSRTHAPDLYRWPELIGLAAIFTIAYALSFHRAKWTDPILRFAAAFALTPFVVFNQQVLTGRSLQPFHYAIFGVNYLALAGLLMAAALVWECARGRGAPRRALALITLVALAGGASEGLLAGRKYFSGNIVRDEARPAMLRLARVGRSGDQLDTKTLVFCTNPTVADALPTVAPQPVLWAPHMFNYAGVSPEEDKERLSIYLHFSGVRLDNVNFGNYEKLDGFRKYFVSSLVGRARHRSELRANWTPITATEVEGALLAYSIFVSSLDRTRVEKFALSYILTSPNEGVDFTNLDRWYERDAGERVGSFILYRVRLRSSPS